jgi:hypothetical protein
LNGKLPTWRVRVMRTSRRLVGGTPGIAALDEKQHPEFVSLRKIG